MSRQIILISSLPLSAFSGPRVEEMASKEYVALTDSDEPGLLILGPNNDHETLVEIAAFFAENPGSVPPRDLPFGLISTLTGTPHLPPEDWKDAHKEVVMDL